MELFIPVEIFRKKSSTFRGITFFPLLRKTIEIFCPICLHRQCQASSREKAKNLPVFCKWYNSFPFLFSVPKKYQYHLTKTFHRNFRTDGKRSTTLHVHHAFLYISLPPLHDYERKMPNFTFMEDVNKGLLNFLSLSVKLVGSRLQRMSKW